MRLKLCLLVGSVAAVAATLAQAQDENSLTERLNRQQLAVHTMPRANLRWRWVWDGYDSRWVLRYYWAERNSAHRNVAYRYAGYARVVPIARPAQPEMVVDRTSGTTEPGAKTETMAALEQPKGDKPAPKETSAAKEQPPTDAKPLNPTELRAAVPLQEVSDPKQALASAEIRSLWGDAIGKVHSVDLNNGAVKTIDADLAGDNRVVKMDASQLKYVKSRNVVLTSMSKTDVEKLPKAEKS